MAPGGSSPWGVFPLFNAGKRGWRARGPFSKELCRGWRGAVGKAERGGPRGSEGGSREDQQLLLLQRPPALCSRAARQGSWREAPRGPAGCRDLLG